MAAKIILLLTTILFTCNLVACSPVSNLTIAAQQSELIIFAAASMTETLEEIAVLYAAVEPNVKLIFNFDSSGTLKTQIEAGAQCDLFISAAQQQMNDLEESGFILQRVDLLENRVTLVVPANNPKNIFSFDDMAALISDNQILMAIGNSDVPVGQYAQRILDYYKLDAEELAAIGCISYSSNVKEVVLQVTEGSADCGIVYATDASSTKLDIVGYADEEICGQVIYPAALLSVSENQEAALDILKYLISSDAMAVFEHVGFTKPF